jgi:hypothetical protein
MDILGEVGEDGGVTTKEVVSGLQAIELGRALLLRNCGRKVGGGNCNERKLLSAQVPGPDI